MSDDLFAGLSRLHCFVYSERLDCASPRILIKSELSTNSPEINSRRGRPQIGNRYSVLSIAAEAHALYCFLAPFLRVTIQLTSGSSVLCHVFRQTLALSVFSCRRILLWNSFNMENKKDTVSRSPLCSGSCITRSVQWGE